MEKFVLEIKTSGAAFNESDGGDLHEEVARILREVAVRVKYGTHSVLLIDSNGNFVGNAKFIK